MMPVGIDNPAKCDNSVIAPVESGSTASRAYAIGEHFIRDGAFCTAKTAIALGAAFTLNTNYTAGQVADISSRFSVLEGTTAANGGNVQLDYPTGFTQSNCVIAGLMINDGSVVGWRSFGNVSVSTVVTAELGSSKIAVSTRATGGASLPFKVFLYRYK